MRELGWSSCDEIAESYDSDSVPHYFERPAERLVALLGISHRDRVLDVGAGTGVVAACALRFAPYVVAADPSWPMLLRGRARAVGIASVARLPLLPFGHESFDRVAASFVLNHLPDPSGALRELGRVIARGGRLGVTTWALGPSDNEAGKLWNETAREFFAPGVLEEQVGKALPGEKPLAEPAYLRDLLSNAGLSVDLVRQVDFPISISAKDYLTSRSLAMTARFMRETLPRERWRLFEQTVERHVLARLGRQLEFTVLVNFAVASKQQVELNSHIG
jgi:SAM-dependent methyltransferase